MKSIEEYLELPYKIEIIKDVNEGGFVASFPELKGCITYGETIAAAVAAAYEAKREWLQAAIDEGYPVPKPGSDEAYSGQFKFRMPKSLHRQLAEHARREGISMNQYCLYLLTKYDTALSR